MNSSRAMSSISALKISRYRLFQAERTCGRGGCPLQQSQTARRRASRGISSASALKTSSFLLRNSVPMRRTRSWTRLSRRLQASSLWKLPGPQVPMGHLTFKISYRSGGGRLARDEAVGLLVAARLVGQHAHKVQGVMVLGGLVQDAAVQGLGQAARPLVPDRPGEALGDRGPSRHGSLTGRP